MVGAFVGTLVGVVLVFGALVGAVVGTLVGEDVVFSALVGAVAVALVGDDHNQDQSLCNNCSGSTC